MNFGKYFGTALMMPRTRTGLMSSFKPGDFHRAAEAQRVAHRRHRHARLGEDGTKLRQFARLGEREAVAFAGLHREFQSEFARRVTGDHEPPQRMNSSAANSPDSRRRLPETRLNRFARTAVTSVRPNKLHAQRVALPLQSPP